MKTRFASFCATVALFFSAAAVSAQTPEQVERIQASFLLAQGRAPSSGEITAWARTGPLSVSELLARHVQELKNDAALQRATVAKACVDAFGREPEAGELQQWSSGNPTYTELMKRHTAWLAQHPAEYEQLFERAYQRVVRRGVYPEEITYWKQRDTLPYALLVGCIENWGHRNAPGLMVTTGTPTISVNSRYLTAVALSPAIAAEARAAAGLVATGDIPFLIAAGRNLIAAGAEDIVTTGHMHLVAVGADNLLSMPASS